MATETKSSVSDGLATEYKTFRVRPQLVESGKTVSRLATSDLISLGVQVVSASGGETNLHAHLGEDAVWLVLNGEATFYGEGDQVMAKIGRYEGLLIPRGAPYWFESSSEENLVVLRFGARAQNEEKRRVDHSARKYGVGSSEGGIAREVKLVEGQFFGD